LPVLELDGQFENLEPYYIAPGEPAAALAGECHSVCLERSPHGPIWFRWRRDGYASGRSYRVALERDGWTVLRHLRSRELLAFHELGTSLGAERTSDGKQPKTWEDGLLLEVDEEFNLSLDDDELIAQIKDGLRASAGFPISGLIDGLGITDRMRWTHTLSGAVFEYDAALEAEWATGAVSMRARYAKYLPSVIAEVWRSL
jgi:hypothetical protein